MSLLKLFGVRSLLLARAATMSRHSHEGVVELRSIATIEINLFLRIQQDGLIKNGSCGQQEGCTCTYDHKLHSLHVIWEIRMWYFQRVVVFCAFRRKGGLYSSLHVIS